MSKPLVSAIERHLDALVMGHPDRHVGRPGNLAANDYAEAVLREYGWAVESVDFEALDCETGAARLTIDEQDFEVQPGYISMDHPLWKRTNRKGYDTIRWGMLKDPKVPGRMKSGVPNVFFCDEWDKLAERTFRMKLRRPEQAQHFEVGDRYVFSCKPNPAIFAEDRWRPEQAKQDLQAVLEKGKGCHIEIIMKDISTVRKQPQRLWEWAQMATELCEEMG